jgi:crossover junction endodeoxyribonuclease RusA
VTEPDVTLDLGPPFGPILSVNRTTGHWAKTSSVKTAWRDGIQWLAQGGKIAGLATIQGRPCALRFVLPFQVGRRRDPSNYVDSVVKWMVDGLVRAGVWPDDNPEYVEVLEPRLVTIPRPGASVKLEVWIRQEAPNA